MIWDVDGTLVNSNDAHTRAWVSAFASCNLYPSFEAIRPLIGMGGDKLLPAAAQIDAESELGRTISARRGEIFTQEHLPKLHAFPKVRELLERLSQRGLRQVVASSAQPQELEALIRIANVQDLLSEKSASSEAGSSKPDPDIVRAALSALGKDPNDVIMVGDTPYDVEAAQRAGVRVIALRCGGRSDRDLAGALAIYDSPADLLARLHESPLAEG